MPRTTWNRRPNVRGAEARNALVEQWSHLPAFWWRRLKHLPHVARLGREDFLQEAFIAMMRAAELWQPGRSEFSTYASRAIKTWTIRCAHLSTLVRVSAGVIESRTRKNFAAKYARQIGAALAPTQNLLKEKHDYGSWLLVRDPDPFEEEFGSEELLLAMRRLSRRQRLVIGLRFRHGMTYRDIGRRIRVDKCNARREAEEALAVLRETMKNAP